ncbi:MAG TPA: hypothetical protein VK563_10355 [Puia sp.]|nr:hypothetical protein [Puia sp.]
MRYFLGIPFVLLAACSGNGGGGSASDSANARFKGTKPDEK